LTNLPLTASDVHVWRISLDRHPDANLFWNDLSPQETERARRFHFERDRHMYVVAHSVLRRVLAGYTGIAANALAFDVGVAGKPALVISVANTHEPALEFNLSHSGNVILIAVARGRAVGIDVERWDRKVEHLSLAEHFFSPYERDALRELSADAEAVNEGFFNAWSRKEAYLKALGTGITQGLHHFDVSLRPGEPATLLADRSDSAATTRWEMMSLVAGSEYSAALVAQAGVRETLCMDFSLS
jgi:4'-phosphopantetheinyl transferase